MKKFHPTWTAFTSDEKIGKTFFANTNRSTYNSGNNDNLTNDLVLMAMKEKASYKKLINHYNKNKVTFIHNVVKFSKK